MEATNDTISGRDDYLTAGWRARVERAGYVVAGDVAILTDKRASTRTDRLALLAGDREQLGALELVALSGVVVDGNLGGEQLQNEWHHLVGNRPAGGHYAGTTWAPAGEARAAYRWGWAELGATGLATRSAWQLTAAARAGDERGTVYGGWAWRGGRELSPTARATAVTMGGLVLGFGLNLGPVGWSLQHQGATTLVGIGALW